jgi:3-dehydroquinate dehydratase / shikimate dehydrogenase
MAEIGLVAALTSRSCYETRKIQTLNRRVDWLEVNADWADEIGIHRVRDSFPEKLIYCLRNNRKNGISKLSITQRITNLRSAVETCDLVDLEAGQDYLPELLSVVPPEKRMISWSGVVGGLGELHRKFEDISRYPARYFKLVTKAIHASDGLIPLSLLKSLARSDVVAYADGPSGFWSRLVAPRLGSPLVYAAIDESSGATEPSVSQLIESYGFPSVTPIRRLYGIVGNSALHSLSPRLHNAAYRSLGIPALFVPFQVESFDDFWENLVEGDGLESFGFPLCGMTVASPYKEAALRLATTCSPIVRQAGAANIFARNGRGSDWRADTTDPESVMVTTHERGIPISSKRVAVIGCGGAGRAVAAVLHQAGAEVTLVNRGKERAGLASKLLGLPFVPLSQFDPTGFSMLVNATPVGRDNTRLPIEVRSLDPGATVIDLAYGKKPTPLVTEASAHGYTVISGYDVLITQVRRQFKMMVGADMPEISDDQVLESRNAGVSVCVPKYATLERNINAAS